MGSGVQRSRYFILKIKTLLGCIYGNILKCGSIRNGGKHLEQAKLTSFVVFSLCIIYFGLGVLYVTDLLSNEAVSHLKEVIKKYQSITETQNALECSYVTILKIISEGFG